MYFLTFLTYDTTLKKIVNKTNYYSIIKLKKYNNLKGCIHEARGKFNKIRNTKYGKETIGFAIHKRPLGKLNLKFYYTIEKFKHLKISNESLKTTKVNKKTNKKYTKIPIAAYLSAFNYMNIKNNKQL